MTTWAPGRPPAPCASLAAAAARAAACAAAWAAARAAAAAAGPAAAEPAAAEPAAGRAGQRSSRPAGQGHGLGWAGCQRCPGPELQQPVLAWGTGCPSPGRQGCRSPAILSASAQAAAERRCLLQPPGRRTAPAARAAPLSVTRCSVQAPAFMSSGWEPPQPPSPRKQDSSPAACMASTVPPVPGTHWPRAPPAPR